jgi:putative membrane protein
LKEVSNTGWKHFVSVFLRGMAMGAADLVPGVSGGTVALITGIYSELIDSLRRCDHRAFMCLLREGIPATWRHINGSFLLAVFSGILLSVFSLAQLITFILETQAILVWSLFFGLIIASAILLLRQVSSWNGSRVGLVLLGVLLALAVSWLKPTQLPVVWWVLLLAGAVAISAMILPGISGGFLLLMMGLYPEIIAAVSTVNLNILIPFALGCGLGLLLFSHVLSWLLHHYEAGSISFLTGILIGSLVIIWPWKKAVETIIDRHGEVVPLVQVNILPSEYALLTGASAQLLQAIIVGVLGIALVLGMEFLAGRKRRPN